MKNAKSLGTVRERERERELFFNEIKRKLKGIKNAVIEHRKDRLFACKST